MVVLFGFVVEASATLPQRPAKCRQRNGKKRLDLIKSGCDKSLLAPKQDIWKD